jgi:hypothetical protein
VAVDQDIGRFDVSMQHAARVGGSQGIGDLEANLADLLFTGPVLRLEPFGQRPARTQFHDQVRPAVGRDASVMGSHHARVIRQSADGGRLAQETAPIALRQLALKDLDRDHPVQRQLTSFPDFGEAPGSEQGPLTQPRNVWMLHEPPPLLNLLLYRLHRLATQQIRRVYCPDRATEPHPDAYQF